MKPHSLIRIKASLVNTPHLIEPNSFSSIMEYVNKRIEGNADLVKVEAATWDDVDGDYSSRYVADTQTGVMNISGPLTYRTSGWEAFCGGTSYEMLKEQMEYFVAKGASTVVMMVDSGGGEAHAMMDSANYIRKLADDNGIKIVAYVDGASCSAAYGISCIADEIVMSSDSNIGSIGVLIQLMNSSKALEKEGLERTFITAGSAKVPFAKDGSFTEGFIERLQTQVDALYEGFTAHVATHRSLDVQAVKDTEANVFMAKEALELGLADKVMSVEEFYDYLATVAQNNLEGKEMGLKDALKFTTKGDVAEMAKLEELETQLRTEQEARATADATLAAHATRLQESQEAVIALTAQIEQYKELQAAADKATLDAKLDARKAALSAVMPVDQVETKLSAYAALDDATFSFMVGELQGAKAARAESFKPEGSDLVEEEENEPTPSANLLHAGVAAAKALYNR